MMYKTVKDKHLMKLTHGSVFVMQEDEKMVKKSSQIDDYINEEALIQKLIKIKQKLLIEEQLKKEGKSKTRLKN